MTDLTLDQTAEDVTEAAIKPAQDVAVREEAPPTLHETQIIRSPLIDLARDPAMDVEKLRVLDEIQAGAEARQAVRLFASAMARVQRLLEPVVRDAEVNLGKDKGGYKYASLDAIYAKCRPVWTEYGFSITSNRAPRQGDGGGFVIASTLWHEGGHFITAEFPLPLDSGPGRNNLQAAGSTDSYGRKYNALGFFDIVRKNQDDDGIKGAWEGIEQTQVDILLSLIENAVFANGKPVTEQAFLRHAASGRDGSPIFHFNEMGKADFQRVENTLRTMQKKENADAKSNS